MTAHDVAFTIAYFQEHPYQWISMDALDRAEAVDDHTVVIHLSTPYAPFLSDIGGTMPVIPEHVWKTVTDPRACIEPACMIGSGPYVFKNFDKTQGTYLFEAFDDYYQGPPKIDRLIYVRTAKALMSLSTGQADLANIQPDMAALLKKKGLTVIENERGWNKKLMINHKNRPLMTVLSAGPWPMPSTGRRSSTNLTGGSAPRPRSGCSALITRCTIPTPLSFPTILKRPRRLSPLWAGHRVRTGYFKKPASRWPWN